MLIGKFPRERISTIPTPLEELKRFSLALGGPRVLVKRDDLTGLGMGGNKARQMEFIMGEAIARGADVVITCGAAQSNHVRQVAAAAAKLGMECYLVLGPAVKMDVQGNILLDRILGAELIWVDTDDPDAQWAEMEKIAEILKRDGRNPYLIPRGGASIQASVAYVNCFIETIAQLNELGVEANVFLTATGTTATQAGVVVAAKWWMRPDFRVIGISVGRKATEQKPVMVKHANHAAESLGAPFKIEENDVTIYDDYIGDGYGIVSRGGLEAIKLMARTEGIFLDPVYSAKAVDGLIGLTRSGVLTKNDTVVYLHTGGLPAIFAYDKELIEGLGL